MEKTKLYLDYKCDSYSVSFHEEGFVYVEIFPEKEVTVQESIEGIDYVVKQVGENKYPVLFFANQFSVPSKEARDFLAKQDSIPYSLADAYVINSFPQKIVANFYMKFNKPSRPTKMFTDISEAIDWLKTFQN